VRATQSYATELPIEKHECREASGKLFVVSRLPSSTPNLSQIVPGGPEESGE
jgi:hypothetical protein